MILMRNQNQQLSDDQIDTTQIWFAFNPTDCPQYLICDQISSKSSPYTASTSVAIAMS